MTYNYCQYEVAYEHRSTTSSSTCRNTPFSRTRNITTCNASGHGLGQKEYNGSFPLAVLQSRARCRTPPAQPSVTCPGERGSSVALGVTAQSAGVAISSMDSDNVAMHHKMEGWPECFQDVSSWCPPDQDELNTPQIITTDEFNFSLDGQVNNCNNQWGYGQSPVEFNDSWANQDLVLPSSNVMVIDEENNNYSLLQNNIAAYPKMDISESGCKVDITSVGASSSSVLKTKGNVLLSQATLLQEGSPQAEEEAPLPFTTDYIKLNSSQFIRLGSGGKLLKPEKKVEEPRVPAVENHLPPVLIQHQEIQPIQPVASKRTGLAKSKPRLKLHIAQTPEQSNDTLTTPEVLSSLIDKNDQFDLLKYVCADSEFSSKTQNVPKVEGLISFQEHDYTDSKSTTNGDVYIKCEPMSPSAAPLRDPLSFEDEDFDSDPSCDSESEEWSPSGKHPRRQSLSDRPKKRVRKPSSIDSSDGQDKYRALRDRNNEASRRSRLNRKQKDMEMKRYRSELEKRNLELKVRADKMETLVKEMRAALLKSVRNLRCFSGGEEIEIKNEPLSPMKVKKEPNSPSSCSDDRKLLECDKDSMAEEAELIDHVYKCTSNSQNEVKRSVCSRSLNLSESTLGIHGYNYARNNYKRQATSSHGFSGGEEIEIKNEPLSPMKVIKEPNSPSSCSNDSKLLECDEDSMVEEAELIDHVYKCTSNSQNEVKRSVFSRSLNLSESTLGIHGYNYARNNYKRQATSSIDSSDGADVKYRSLRDRNNESSRKSRLIRRIKEYELQRKKGELEARNSELKCKAERIESMVKELRDAIKVLKK